MATARKADGRSRTRPAAAGAVAACLWLVAALCFGASQGEAAVERQGKPKLVFVWATTGGGRELGRPHGALVRIRHGGRTIGRARTGARGIAVVRLRRAPRRFSVQVSGGRLRGHRVGRVRGSLRARVSGYRGQSVYVNPATTLAHYYKALHPRLPERRARNRVRAFLRLPRGHNIVGDLRSTPYFDGRRYVIAARRAGGLDRYTRALARTIGRRRGKGRSFATRRGGRAAKPARGRAGISVGEGGSLGALAELSGNLAAYQGIFGAIGGVSGALGIVNTIMSLSGATPLDSEVEQLGEEMQELLAAMHYVEGQLAEIDGSIESLRKEDAEGFYTVLKQQQTDLLGKIDEARNQLDEIVNLGAQISCPGGTAECPEGKPVEQICAAAPGRADCEKLKTLYTGAGGLVEIMANHGLTDYSSAHSLARSLGGEGDGLIKYASLVTVAENRFYTREQGAPAVSAADYYLAQLSFLISLIGTYQTAPTVALPTVNVEAGLKGITEATAGLPGLVPGLLPGTDVIDTSTGLMWQTQIAANTILDGKGSFPLLPYPYLLNLHSIHGATAWEMANAGNFHYSDGWIAGDGSLKVPRTLGDDAPSSLSSRIWRPAPANALANLIAGTSYAEMVEAAGFSPKLFTPVRTGSGNLLVYDALFVATLPGDGERSDFNSDDDVAPLYGGLFNFKRSAPKPDVGVVALNELDDLSLNFLMYRTPFHSECWYYAQAGRPASC